MEEKKTMKERMAVVREKVENGVVHILKFTREHPIITSVATTVVTSAVVGGVSYVKGKNDGILKACDDVADFMNEGLGEKKVVMWSTEGAKFDIGDGTYYESASEMNNYAVEILSSGLGYAHLENGDKLLINVKDNAIDIWDGSSGYLNDVIEHLENANK